MRHLLVIGASGNDCPPDIATTIQNALHRWPDYVHYAAYPSEAFQILGNLPTSTVLAYAPGIFGAARSGQPARIATDQPQVILTVGVEQPSPVVIVGEGDQDSGSDDPRQFLAGAWLMLQVQTAIDVTSEIGLDVLHNILTDESHAEAF